MLGMYWTEGSETLMNVYVTKKYLSFWDGQKFRSLFKFKVLLVSMHILFVFFFCVCLLQTGTKCREFIWSSVPFNDASGPSFKHTPTTNFAAQVISTQKAEPKKYWKRVGFQKNIDSDWNCGCSKEELEFSSHLRHLESQLECYNLQRQNYLVTDIEITRASRPSSSCSQNRFSIHMKLR